MRRVLPAPLATVDHPSPGDDYCQLAPRHGVAVLDGVMPKVLAHRVQRKSPEVKIKILRIALHSKSAL